MRIFEKYINAENTVLLEEWELIKNTGRLTHVRKEELLAQQNILFKDEVFIEKGVMRAYMIDDDGNDKSIAFFQKGEFMSISTLRTKNGKSLHYYQALCETKLLLFKPEVIRSFLSRNNSLIQIGKNIKEKEIERLRNRDNCLLQVRAKDKYLSFLKYYPNLEMHISQKHIASYLGITPVSLSRLKSDLKKNKTDNN